MPTLASGTINHLGRPHDPRKFIRSIADARNEYSSASFHAVRFIALNGRMAACPSWLT
jgi:hypothetical protein